MAYKKITATLISVVDKIVLNGLIQSEQLDTLNY